MNFLIVYSTPEITKKDDQYFHFGENFKLREAHRLRRNEKTFGRRTLTKRNFYINYVLQEANLLVFYSLQRVTKYNKRIHHNKRTVAIK